MGKINKKFLSDIELIRKASQTKKLVIFVGAGISMNSDVPSWSELIEQLKSDIGIEANEIRDDLQVAQVYFNEKKHKEYVEKIRKSLFHKKAKYNKLHEIVFDLNPEYILTTNYDDLLEQVVQKRALPFSIIKKDTDFPYASNSNLIVKIHGDLENDDFVLKEDDYIEYEANHPLFEAFIKYVFSTKVVLFVGYGYSDINLKVILQKVRKILGVNFQNSFLISNASMSDYKINYLKNRGVNILSYEENEEFINDYLNGKNSDEFIYSVDKLSKPQGNALFRFLTFIKTYDRFKEDLKNKDIVDQIYQSLVRYKEVKSLPYFFISNIYPFNSQNKSIYKNEYSPFNLYVYNKKIIEYFNSNTETINGETVFTNAYINTKITEYEKNQIKERLEYIIMVLLNSGIYYLSETIYPNRKTVALNSKLEEVCNCKQCLFNNLKLKELIAQVSESNILEASVLSEDCLAAYINYKLGNIYNAYMMFEEIAQKAWLAENYIIYFISKINLKRLGHFIIYAEHTHYSSEVLEQLRQKSTQIDLDSEYIQINMVSKEEAKLIKIIRDDDLLKYSDEVISNSYNDIYKNYELSKYNVIYFDNEREIMKINFHLNSMNLFYEKNFIVNDYFSNYKSIVETACKAIFLDQVTNSKFQSLNDNISDFCCKNFILYASASDFNTFFTNYTIDELSVNDEGKKYILEMADNFLKSFYSHDGSFGESVTSDLRLAFQVKKDEISKRFSGRFDNILLLLSKISLEKSEINGFIENLANFLEVCNFIYWENMKYVSQFILSCSEKTDNIIIIKLLRSVSLNMKIFTSDFTDAIGIIFKDRLSTNRLNDNELSQDLINIAIKQKKDGVHFNSENLINIWGFVNDDFRKAISNLYIFELEEEFDAPLYFKLSIRSIIDYKSHFEKYVHFVNEKKENYKEDIFDRKSESGILNNTFIKFIILLRELEVPNDESKFELFDNLEDYMKFYIDPNNFDYEKFNIKWLLLTFNPKVHMELSNYTKVIKYFKDYLTENVDSYNRNLADLYFKYYVLK